MANWPHFYFMYRQAMRLLILAVGAMGAVALIPHLSRAASVTAVSFSNTDITFQTGTPNGTTITFTLDAAGDVTFEFKAITNASDPGTTVDTITQSFTGGVGKQFFWNALWLIDGELGRRNGSYRVTITHDDGAATATVSPSTILTINSLDIHSVSVAASAGSDGSPAPPFTITYALAKEANVTATIRNSSGTLVRTLLNNRLQVGESIAALQTLIWDGLDDGGSAVPLGAFTLYLNATAPHPGTDRATQRTRTIAVTSLAGASVDAKKLFEQNVYVYPNPVRDGNTVFRMQSVRNNSRLFLKIYTMTGDLVRSVDFPNRGSGEVVFWPWNTANEAGKAVGRGLYFYVVREESPEGDLSVTKKVAVIR